MKRTIIMLSIGSILLGQTNISIGGNNSFNNNSGTIKISQTELIKNEQIAIDEILGKEMLKSTLLTTLVGKAKIINNIKTTRQDKQRRCKDEVSGMLNIFGNEISLGYKKCENWF